MYIEFCKDENCFVCGQCDNGEDGGEGRITVHLDNPGGGGVTRNIAILPQTHGQIVSLFTLCFILNGCIVFSGLDHLNLQMWL